MKRILFVFSLSCIFFLQQPVAQKPEVEVLTSGRKTSLRGLSVVNDNVVWVSGSNGTVGRSNNGGKNWNWFTVKGFEKTEFRDIEAFDAQNAVIMAVADPAYILKTGDGGETWKVVYENREKGMFLDAMDFINAYSGIVVGDPINGKVFFAHTTDGGETWIHGNPLGQTMVADSGEAFFAASGTNIRSFVKNNFYVVSGGTRSRLFMPGKTIDLPVIQGKETTGANSIAVFDKGGKNASQRMIVVGGDFNSDTSSLKNCFYTLNGGKEWKAPRTAPHGYRSCVEYLSQNDLLTCGLTGVDYSSNSGKDWNLISKESFHVVRIAKYGSHIYLAGNNGKIGKVVWK